MIRKVLALWWACFVGFSCSSAPEWPGEVTVLGMDQTQGPPGTVPAAFGGGVVKAGPVATVGESCRTDDSSRICLGLKYVVYSDGIQAVVGQAEAIQNIRQVNSVWNQCGIQFQIDQFHAINPADHNLAYRTSNYPELDAIRSKLADPRTLLLVTTGPWNRSGTLGNTSANAWTSMPNSGPFGVIMEKSVGTYPNIIAHELGHYLNLLHLSDPTDLMNPIIYTKSTSIPPAQCTLARQAANYFWVAAQR